MGDLVIDASRLVPSKRMDVMENHYGLMGERPELVPRYAKFVRHMVHYGVTADHAEILEPIKAMRRDDGKYVIVKGNGRALAYQVLELPLPVHVITPYDFMRPLDAGNNEELARAKIRLQEAASAIATYRKECSKLKINTLDDLLDSSKLDEFFAQYDDNMAVIRSRIEEYDTKRIALKSRRKDDVFAPQVAEPSFSDIKTSGLETEPPPLVQSAKKIIYDYISRRNGHV